VLAILVVAANSGSALVSAQTSATSSVAGSVADQTGAALPEAQVLVTHDASRVARRVVTNADGTFEVSLLVPGVYRVRLEAPGFRPVETTVALDVGERRVIKLTMDVGNFEETVAIEAPIAVSTQTGTAVVVDADDIARLPLNGRNFQRLILLAPGVGAATGPNPVFSGSRGSANTYTIDGLNASDQREQRGLSLGGGAALLSNSAPNLIPTEALQEFRVTSSNADATFGRGSGGQVSVVTRSGSNAFRGSAFYYGRDDRFDARDFFNSGPFFDANGRAVPPPFTQHQGGGSLGGPLRRNRHFFFGAFEGFRQDLKQTDASTVVPNAALIDLMPGDLGRFYRTFYIDRNVIPSTGNPPGELRPIYASNDERLRYLGAGYQPAYFDGDITNEEAGLVRIVSARTKNVVQDSFVIRTDHSLSDRVSLAVRYAHARPEQITDLLAYPNDNTANRLRWHHGLVQSTFAPTSAQVMEFRGGVMRSEYAEGSVAGVDEQLRGIGVSEFGISVNPAGTGLSQLFANPQRNFFDDQTVPEFSVTHTWTKGRMALRSGAQWRRSALDTFSGGSATPVYTFNGFLGPSGLLGADATQREALVSSATVTLYGANGGPQTPLRRWRQHEQEYFAQADVAITRRLTLNLGLRYAYFSVLTEADGTLSNLYAVDEEDAVVADASPFAFGRRSNRVEPIANGRPLYQPDRNNWQPRLGLAWDLLGTGRTVVKGAYGAYTDRLYQLMILSAPNSTPFAANGAVASTPDAPVPFRLGALPAINFSAPGVFGIDPTIRNPTIHRYQVSLQQDMPWSLSAYAAYVGARGRGLAWNANLNAGSFGVPQDARPDPRFGLETITTGTGRSQYDALQVRLERRFSRGVAFGASYTYARALDNVSDEAFGSPPALLNLGASPAAGFQGGGTLWTERPIDLNWGRSDFDLRHNLTLTHTIELPFGRGRRFLNNTGSVVDALLGGYSLSGLAILRSGQPFTPILFGDFGDVGSFTYRPALVSGNLDDLYADGRLGPTQYLLPANEANSRLGLPADVNDIAAGIRRNSMTGPRVMTYDVSLSKRLQLTGSLQLGIEINAFNVFNRANFATPTTNLSSPFFGQVTATAPGTTPRQLQFGARLSF
jgi:hypothetical protein